MNNFRKISDFHANQMATIMSCLSGKEESLAKKSLSGEVKRTLETAYQNQTENSTVYRYLCTDGVDVWYEERLRQL